jgi:hypothetical protein
MLISEGLEAGLVAMEHFPQIRWYMKQSAGTVDPILPACLRTKIANGKCYATTYNLCTPDQEYLRQQHPKVVFEFKDGAPPEAVSKFEAEELENQFSNDGAKELYHYLSAKLAEDNRILKCFEDLPIRMVAFRWYRDNWVENVGYVCETGHIGLYNLEHSSVPAEEKILKEWSGTYTDDQGMVWQAKIEPGQFCFTITAYYIDTRPRIVLGVGANAAQ